MAFVNYQVITLGQISKANDNSFIKIYELSTEELGRLKRYDMVFVNAMGLRITAEQRELVQKAARKGVPIMTSAATNPANDIVSVDPAQAEALQEYLTNGGRRNYRNMLNYVRVFVDGKKLRSVMPQAAVLRESEMLYHADPLDLDSEELGFGSVAEYEAWLRGKGLFREDAPKVVVTGPMGEPTDLIAKLEETGNVVYPVRSIRSFVLQHHIDSVGPSAVINMAHGRMGDYIVDYLKEQNIPLFAPLNVNRLVEEWEEDKMGMNGGFLSQSVVTPEIDGAIRPFVLFGHRYNEEGLQQIYAIPERLETFVETVNNYIALQRKSNSQKRVAIYYYKGPGQNAMTASGMEVVPSLYNLLRRMKSEGYRVEGLPGSAAELGRLIQTHGPVFGTYAEGAAEAFLESGEPALVSREEYEEWCGKALRREMVQEMQEVNGEFPGQYLSTSDGRLGLARLEFGNVVLLPQNAAGGGDNAFKMVHGTDAAPPYAYVASYLWARYGFGADVLIHFGTHGSLEFTPRKQVALDSNDWPDRLVGSLPHFYIYSIDNVGEGMIAKRRSYAGLQSYLTPPFMESSLRGTYRELSEAIKIYNGLLGDESAAEGATHGGVGASTGKTEALEKASLEVKRLTVRMGIHRELELDSLMTVPYSEEEILKIENFAEELATEKITGQLYTMGVPYDPDRITSSVYSMATEPIAYSLLALDKLRGKASEGAEKHKTLFTEQYVEPARELVGRLLANPALATDAFVCRIAGITPEELAKAHEVEEARNAPQNMMSMMMSMAEEVPEAGARHADVGAARGESGVAGDTVDAGSQSAAGQSGVQSDGMSGRMHSRMVEMGKKLGPEKALQMAKKMGAPPEALKKMEEKMLGESTAETTGSTSAADSTASPVTAASTGQPASPMEEMMRAMIGNDYTKEEVNLALAILEVERTLKNVGNYKAALLVSPENELASLINAMNGGYTVPSAGGDPIVNPNTLPTGRNLFAINAEETPTESAWEKGKQLADNTIAMYRRHHNDSIPRKVSYTLWSGEFIETGGATIAQVLYMLGVEPIRDVFGRVTDLRLIPSAELGRPRIDVVVQTSGQLRDIAASRLFLITRAVEMASGATDDIYENFVNEGVVEAERVLTEKGLTPKEAREISTYRVFGGTGGNYGTGIQAMVQKGDSWDTEEQIADVYLNNMGAFYGSEKNWETLRQYAFEAALTRTDVVIQPRQSNTWGALSLDHVYEFMGGMNLAVRNITGKDPDAYLSDYRNRNNARMQEVKEAIGVESRTTIFNPAYISEKMKGDAGAANTFAEIVQNTYGWNVMKPEAVDNEMWDEIYNVYVKDKFDLGVQGYFENQNPAALEEMTAVMLETVRKGLWDASDQQIADIAKLHTDLVNKYKPSCSGFVCDNAKLRQYIASKTDPQAAAQYKDNISQIREAAAVRDQKGMVMKKEDISSNTERQIGSVSNVAVGAVVVAAIVVLILLVRRRRKQEE